MGWTLGSTNIEGGLHSPFQSRPSLTRSPKIINWYAHPHRNLYWLEALDQLMDREWCSPASSKSLGFFNLFLAPKPHNHSRPILGLSKPNLSETIRTTLQQWEWVPSIDFKDAYFYIPIQEQSRKYLRFHVQGWTYRFKALSFGLSTAPMELTVVAKELKLMAIHKGIITHQYLYDWLGKATSHQLFSSINRN